MPFAFLSGELPGIVIVTPRVLADQRGFFLESFKRSEFLAAGIELPFVQENLSRSSQGVLRGLHYQIEPAAQGKLVTAIAGSIFDVALDLRRGSPTFGRWTGCALTDTDRRMLWIPRGFAHGFAVLSETATVMYKVTAAEYAPDLERGIAWNDPTIGIAWPIADPVLSPKDSRLPRLSEAEHNFDYEELSK